MLVILLVKKSMTFSLFPFLPSVDPQGLAPDLVPWQAFPMAHTHRHCIQSPLRGQPACYLRALHPRHLWPHWYVYTGRMAVELCDHSLCTTLNKLSSSFLFRSHICAQPHLHLTWNLLRADRSWGAGAFSFQTQDSGTPRFLQLSRMPQIYLGH